MYFMLERLSLTPSGTRKNSGVVTHSFTKVFSSPMPDTSGLGTFLLEGCVSNPENVGTSTTQSSEPALRVCTNPVTTGGSEGDIIYALWSYAATSETGTILFNIAYIGSEWRLYYGFQFGLANDCYVYNPSRVSIGTVVATGSVSLGGYSLSWSAVNEAGGSITFEGTGLALSDTFWTF